SLHSHPPLPTLFPYTTLFRSDLVRDLEALARRSALRRLLQRRAELAAPPAALRAEARGDHRHAHLVFERRVDDGAEDDVRVLVRSEEHTSELQSRSDLVCRLL